MAEKCLSYTLSEVVDGYLLRQMNLKRKYYKIYLALSQDVWKKLFWTTLYVVKNTWVTIQGAGPNDPYDFIWVPKDCLRYLSVSVEDECGNLTPLYYNTKMDVIKKPDKTDCGCDICGGTGLKTQLEGLSVVTKPIVINGQTYYQRTWIKYCKNGDVIEQQDIPTKKYSNPQEQAGDYNNDYNNDYNVITDFGDYTIVTETIVKRLCQLDVKPCGCPKDTQENEDLFFGCCGCYVSWWARKRYCDRFLSKINYNGRGEIKMSKDGCKIYLRQPRCTPEQLKTKRFVAIKYQTNGIKPAEDVLVPDYARFYMYAGLDVESKEFNPRFSIAEKRDADERLERKWQDLVLFLNHFDLEFLSNIQDAPNVW